LLEAFTLLASDEARVGSWQLRYISYNNMAVVQTHVVGTPWAVLNQGTQHQPTKCTIFKLTFNS